MNFDWVTHYAQIVTQGAQNLGWPTEAFFRLLLAAVMGGLVGSASCAAGRRGSVPTYWSASAVRW